MFSWDWMVLSRSFDFFNIEVEGLRRWNLNVEVNDGSNSKLVSSVSAFIFPTFFVNGTSLRLCPSYILWLLRSSQVGSPKILAVDTKSLFCSMSIPKIKDENPRVMR